MTDPVVRRTRSPVPAPTGHQCQQPFLPVQTANGYPLESYFRSRAAKLVRRGFDPAFCGKASSWEVEGRRYCGVHAGIVALEILEKRGQAASTEGSRE